MLRHPSLIPLSHQHQHALALCVTIDRALRSGPTPSSGPAPDAGQDPPPARAPYAGQAPLGSQVPSAGPSPEQTALLARKAADLFEIEIKNHFDIEERILFPAIREHLGSLPLVDELIEEHRHLEALIARLPETLAEFGSTLSAHIRKEERDLFEDIQQRLSAQTLEQLKEKIAADVVRVCL
jgi:iron-sulfur cluster repair protein YtfE (RIC family)